MPSKDRLKILILYYSGTGNTKFACEVARRVMERSGQDVTMQTYAESNAAKLQGFDLYCFATPVYEWAPAGNVERFVEGMQPMPGKPAFIVSSSAGMIGQADNIFARMLQRKGLKVLGDHNLVCPDSWGGTRRWSYKQDAEVPSVQGIEELAAFTGRMLKMAGDYLARQRYDAREYSVRKTGLYWASRLSRMAPGPRFKMGKKKVDSSICTKCDVCVKNCPMEAISLDPYPVFSRGCIGCWRCINTCPRDCITSGLDSGRHYKGIKGSENLLKKAGL